MLQISQIEIHEDFSLRTAGLRPARWGKVGTVVPDGSFKFHDLMIAAAIGAHRTAPTAHWFALPGELSLLRPVIF
jgi:hypothetical protein